MIDNAQNKDWISAQLWAREHTQIDSVFITPPELEGFRIESERTTYAEYKDGTQMFFNPGFGKEWFARMQKLGFKNPGTIRADYQKLSENDFQRIAAQIDGIKRPIFVVRHFDTRMLRFPVVYRDAGFTIYKIDLGQGI